MWYCKRRTEIIMSRKKIISFAILIAVIIIQFIQPAHNKSEQVLPTGFITMYKVPSNVQKVLQNACYDCHTNHTNYPWYANIQPMGWLMANHIKNGKETLNFSEFESYSARRKLNKLTGIANSVRDGDMPLKSYQLMHINAQITKDENALIISWIQQLKDSLAVQKLKE